MNNTTKLVIWAAVIGVAFGLLWYRGYLNRLRDYCAATVEELKKCSWPTRQELAGSTLVVAISIGLLGAFTVVVDRLFFLINFWISKA